MHKPRPELYFVNTLLSIDKLQRNIKNLSYEKFISDEKTFGFITRELQEIGESIRKLLQLYNLKKQKVGNISSLLWSLWLTQMPE